MTSLPGVHNFIRPSLLNISGFPVGKGPSRASMDGKSQIKTVKLSANENPFGHATEVHSALSHFAEYHLYPDASQSELRSLIAEYVGVGPEHIIGTAGADQLLELVIRLFVDPGDEVITCIPSFGVVQFLTRLCGGIPIELPRDDHFNIQVETIINSISQKTKLIYLCTPNNPTGNLIPREHIIEILKTGVPVIIDEAYFEFSKETMVSALGQFSNMIIMRTFSKWAGLAGFRLGYGITSSEIVSHLMSIRLPFNVATPALLALRGSMGNLTYLNGNISKLIQLREALFQQLNTVPYIRPYPSHANFILCTMINTSVHDLVRFMESNGLLVHTIDTPELPNSLRISVGTEDQNRLLVDTLLNFRPVPTPVGVEGM